MSKQIQVNLAFNADTAKAKQQINDLINSLNQISNKNTQIFDDREFREAANAARDLTKHLEAAVNVNTGKLDLNKFSQSLSQSKQSLSDLYNGLSKAGPQGQQAFLQLASSIASSESQVLNLNSKVKDLGQTLKNTVKWQLSSSLVHGFMGALQHAFGYAQDLNSSLNDIRIVTGASAEEMAKFAEQANKSAKVLSSTTNEYAKASLIYYQQGLSDSEVQERTDITIKMANVSKESAQTVSDQMTAVWNNFYDGSKSLEYYADVMTALGAATASSVDEIAGGLEKFAAIGDTIGLSYEYAAAALATITSNTRESEEVVGTALKTIFARIQGLSLGETLDDSTTLNKYSQALEKVGISIFDQAGELKAMDNILAELGSKWQTLSKDQQTALAQTVAGVRQYTQLVALMDNWDSGDSDSFMANLSTAYNSEGALQEQQDIYAESWEAAADRVKAATEDIYDSLLNDEAIISILNGLENILNLIGSLIDGFGGLKGIILLVGATFAKSFAKEVPDAIDKIKTNLKIISGQAEKEKQANVKEASKIITDNQSSFKGGNLIRAQATNEELASLLELEAIRDRITESEYEYIRSKIAEKKASKEAVAVKQDEIEQLKKEYELKQKKNITSSAKKAKKTPEDRKLLLEEEKDILNARKSSLEEGRDKLLAKVKKGDSLSIKQATDLDSYNQELQSIEQRNQALQESIDLETRRQAIIEKENLQKFDDNDEIIGIDQQKYQQLVADKTQQLQQVYQKQETNRLNIEDYNNQISSWTASASSMKLKDLGADEQKKEVEKLKESVKKYAESLKEANNVQFSQEKFDILEAELEEIDSNAEQVIAKFKEFASSADIEKATQALEETSQEVEQLRSDLEALTGDNFNKIDNEAREAAESIALAEHALQQLENSSNQIDVDVNVDASDIASTLTELSSIAMDVGTIFTSLSAMIKAWGDDSLSVTEKFTTSLSSLGVAAISAIQIFSTISNPTFLNGIKGIGTALTTASASGGIFAGIVGKLGTAFTTAGASVSSFLGLLLKFAGWVGIAVAAILLLINAWEKYKASTPEGQLNAAKEATSAMTTAANEANTAYQNLLNTINGYDSAVSALEGLEAGTQEFTDALITANEKAWELIDAYGLIQGTKNGDGDWYYGENGEIVIKQSAKDRITNEVNERREDIIVGQSAATIREKEAAYNVAKDEAGYWGSNLTEDVRQNLYDALGFTNGTSKHVSNKWSQAKTDDDFKAIIDEVGKKYYGDKWDFNNADVEEVDFIRSSIANMEKIGNMFDAYTDLQRTEDNERQKMLSTSLSDEEAYQNSNWKNLILDTLNTQYEDEKKRADSRWDKDVKDDADIEKAFAEYLGDQNYTQKDGKVYDKDGNEIAELSNLSIDAQRNILAAADAISVLETQGIQLAESFNKVATTMSEDEAAFAKAIIDNDISSLTEGQIKRLQEMGDLALTDLFDVDTVAMIKSNPTLLNAITEWLDNLEQAVADWKPPEFDLDTWKKDYVAKINAIDNIDEYGGIDTDSDEWTTLSSEYSEYFDIQNDGTARLKIAAEEFKAIVEGIELNKLKESIVNDQMIRENAENILAEKSNGVLTNVETIDTSAKSYLNSIDTGKMTENWASGLLQGDITQAIKEALNVNLEDFGTSAIEQLQGLSQAWIDLADNLDSRQDAFASTANSLDELRNQFNDGTIDIEEYNDAIDATVAKEAELEDIDYKEVLDYAEYLSENADKLEDVDDALQGNLKESKKVAMAHAKLNKAVETLSDNWEDWNKAIKSGDMDQILKYLPDINDALKDMLDLTDENFENLSSDFAIKNWDTIKDVVNGVEGSLEKLQVAASEDMILQIKPELEGTETLNEMSTLLSELTNMAVGTEISIDPKVDNTNAFDGLVELLSQAGFTVDQINSILEGIGWDPQIELVEMDVEGYYDQNSSGYQDVAVLQPDGSYRIESMPLAGAQALAQNGKIKVPKISGTKKSGGSGSYTPKKTGSGGGGGGSKPKEPTHAEKKSSSEKTRYHTLQNQLEDLKDEYDALADASDRAFGQDKLDAIDAEIKKTDELIDKQEEYLQAIQSNLPVDKSVMTAYYNDTIGGPAMQFDENGNISNYDQIQDAMFDKYNAMTSYDEDSVQWQTFEKKYEQLEKYIEQYEETYDLLREEEANYQDLLNQRIDLELEKVEYKVEIELEVPENQKEVIEYQLGRIEDDAKKTGEALALLTEQAEMTYDQILINKQGLNDALELSLSAAEITEVMAGNMDVLNGKTFTEDQISAIQDYKDNLLELNEEFDDIRESIEETVLEAFDMWHEKLEEGIEKFDYFGTILESYQSIIDTVGKDTLGISDSLMNTLSQASVDNAINEVEATRDAYKALQQAQIDAERELEKAKAHGDEQSISFWESTLNEIQQNAEDAHEEMLDSWEEALSKIVEQFEASIQTAVDAFNEAVYQLGGIEALSEEFDRQKEMADMYLDDYQKIYELSKLNRDVNNSIDDTDSLAGKQKLKKLLGEINKLQADGVKMSEYDLEYLQAEYDLRLAEIALEEAQRAKDVVRLSRDNEGNWSYVYTQNTEAVDEAQQKYEDALYAMQDLSSNYIDEISAQLIETSQEMQEALAAIRIEDYASIEEYYEEVERVQEQYQEQLALQEEELNKAVANNKELYDTDWTNYHNAVGYKISDTEEFATKFSDTLLGTLMNSESDTSNFTSILADATSTLMNELYGAAEQYYTNMAAAMEAAGTTTGTFADDLATNVDQIKQDSEEAATAVEDMATQMQDQMDNIINKVGEWQRTYGEAMNEIINANLAVIDSFNEMLATLSMDDSTVTVKYDIQNHNSDVLDAERFATGGYTGSWGNTGRLGILDEKELILNKDDTENFIEALKISRSMLNTIELNARQASLGLGALIPTTIKDDIKETLEQVVQITAEFPNAIDHNEIEEAFNSLINYSSQYANRK